MWLTRHSQTIASVAFRVLTCVAVALVTMSFTGAALGQDSNKPNRVVIAQPGANVVAQLRPSDTALDIVSSQSGPLIVEPPAGQSAVDFYSSIADLVLLVEVTKAKARITDDEDFIQTDIEASLVEVLKADPAVSVLQPLRFSFPGGEVSIGGKPVRGVVPWTRGVRVGAQYLVFADLDKATGKLVFGPAATFEKADDEFQSLLADAPARMKLAGKSVDVLQAIRR